MDRVGPISTLTPQPTGSAPRTLPRTSLAAGLALLLTPLLPAVAAAQCRFDQQGDPAEPEGRLVLENEFVRLEAAPASGGRVVRFLYKPAGKELVHMAPTAAAPQGAGLLLDIGRRHWSLPYDWEVVAESPERVALGLSRRLSVGRGREDKVLLKKLIELRQGRSSVLVTYQFSNVGDEPFVFKFRLTNVFCPGGPKAAGRQVSFPYGWHAERYSASIAAVGETKPERSTFLYRLAAETSENHWVMAPTRSWFGLRDPSGLGVGIEADFAYIDALYSWFPSTQTGAGFPTSEVFYRPVELRPFKADPDEVVLDPNLLGNVFKQTVRLAPFDGLPRFDGCRNGVAAGIEAEAGTVRLHCAADRPLRGTARILLREPAGAELKEAAAGPAALAPGRTSVLTFAVPGAGAGKVVIARLLDEAGQAVAEFERPVGEAARRDYVQLPQGKRAPRALGAPPNWRPDDWTPTPHVKWAKPLASGPLKILCVVTARGLADLLELEQRLDADVDYLVSNYPHSFIKAFEAGKMADCTAAFPELLNGERKYDVILLASGMYWDRFPAKMQELILDRVREGTGLVYVRGLAQAGKFDAVPKQPAADPGALSAALQTLPLHCLPRNREKRTVEQLVRCDAIGSGLVTQCLWNMWVEYKPYRAEGLVPHPIEETEIPPFRYWEYAHALLAKLIRAAARREPPARFVAVRRDTDAPAQAGAPLGQLTLTIEASAAADLELEAVVCDRFHQRVDVVRKDLALKPGVTELSLDLPAVGADGDHPVDIRLLQDGKSVDWAAAIVPVRAPVAVAEASFAKDLHELREAPVLRLELTNASGAAAAARLRVRVVDAWGRCVRDFRAPLDVPAAAADEVIRKDVTLPAFTPVSPFHRAEITLTGPDDAVSERHVPFSVALPLPLDYAFICWSGYPISSHYTDMRHVELVRSIGYDLYSMYQHGENVRPYSLVARAKGFETVTQAGLRPLAQSVSHIASHFRPERGVPKIRPEPLCNAEHRAKVGERIRAVCSAARRFYLHAVSSGDEPSLGWYDRAQDFDHSPETLERFRARLRQVYGDLGRLSAVWGKQFGSWDEVVPDTFAEARARNHFASWADHRLYMETELADFLQFFEAEVKRHSGGAPMALSGMGFGGVFNGFDFSRLMPLLNFSSLYGDGDGEFAKPEVQRSFQPKGALNGVWIGYGNTEEFLRAWIWLQSLSDKFLISVYSSTYQVHCERYLTERGRFYRELFGEYRESGAGTVLRAAERVEDPIAILYSKPSVLGAAVTGLANRQYSVASLRRNRDAWPRVVQDAGFNCRFVSNWQTAEGVLQQQGCKVLILPLIQSLSPAAASRIKDFVSNGGLLIADVRAAVLDEHCVRYDVSPLDEVFGLDRTQVKPADAGNAIEVRGGPELCRASAFRGTPLEQGIQLKGARALGRGLLSMQGRDGAYGTLEVKAEKSVSRKLADVLFVNRCGKGAAVYCNFMLDDYLEKLSRGTDRQVNAVFADVFRNLAGLRPRAQVLKDGELLPDTHVVCYRSGRTWLVAVQRHTYSYRYARLTEDKPEPVTVSLPISGAVYDVWTRRSLGTGKTVQDVLELGARRLYVVLPYKTTGIELNGPASVAQGEECILHAAVRREGAGESEQHVFRVTVARPDGSAAEWFARNLTAPAGRCRLTLPIAADAPAGRWQVKIRDVLTNVAATRTLEVAPHRP